MSREDRTALLPDTEMPAAWVIGFHPRDFHHCGWREAGDVRSAYTVAPPRTVPSHAWPDDGAVLDARAPEAPEAVAGARAALLRAALSAS